jgi:hypothetical protein
VGHLCGCKSCSIVPHRYGASYERRGEANSNTRQSADTMQRQVSWWVVSGCVDDCVVSHVNVAREVQLYTYYVLPSTCILASCLRPVYPCRAPRGVKETMILTTDRLRLVPRHLPPPESVSHRLGFAPPSTIVAETRTVTNPQCSEHHPIAVEEQPSRFHWNCYRRLAQRLGRAPTERVHPHLAGYCHCPLCVCL